MTSGDGVNQGNDPLAPLIQRVTSHKAAGEPAGQSTPDSATLESFSAKAPAKLNLFLHITGRRPDGYHELQTVFELLDLADELVFTPLASAEISLQTGFQDVAPDDNLVVRAARLLKQHSDYAGGCRISLDKHLPSGAGLGGGSSDAATTLVVLNQLWGTGLSNAELRSLGASLGADVPVFIGGKPCWAEGIGELLQPLALPQRWYVIIYPGVHVPTASIFQDPALTRNCSTITIADFQAGQTKNVCQPVVFRRFPEVGFACQWLEKAFRDLVGNEAENEAGNDGVINAEANVAMTGTGSCVYARCATRQQALNLYEKVSGLLRDPTQAPSASDSSEADTEFARVVDYKIYLAESCATSPLYR